MFGHAALTPPAMLTPQWCPDHARNTKVGLVELPQADQLVDDRFLLGNPIHLGHEPGVVADAPNIEPSCHGIEGNKRKVHEPGPVCLELAPR